MVRTARSHLGGAHLRDRLHSSAWRSSVPAAFPSPTEPAAGMTKWNDDAACKRSGRSGNRLRNLCRYDDAPAWRRRAAAQLRDFLRSPCRFEPRAQPRGRVAEQAADAGRTRPDRPQVFSRQSRHRRRGTRARDDRQGTRGNRLHSAPRARASREVRPHARPDRRGPEQPQHHQQGPACRRSSA